jgi:hypothetical protein
MRNRADLHCSHIRSDAVSIEAIEAAPPISLGSVHAACPELHVIGAVGTIVPRS